MGHRRDVAGDDQAAVETLRDVDGGVRSFAAVEPAEKHERGRRRVGVGPECVARGIGAVVDDAPVAAARRARVADGRADGREVHALRPEARGLAHVLGIDRPHVRLHLRHVPAEDRGQVRKPAEVVNHIEAAVITDEARAQRQRVAEVAPARPLAFFAKRLEPRRGAGAGAGPERHLVSTADEAVSKIGDDAFDAAIVLRWDGDQRIHDE